MGFVDTVEKSGFLGCFLVLTPIVGGRGWGCGTLTPSEVVL